ncbi:hypothetical protein ACCS95_06675 [Rhizobium ruizarguesonis]
MLERLVDKPRAVLKAGASCAVFFLLVSIVTHDWTWFPRGGAVLALAGFMVSVREALLYRSPREPRYNNVAAVAVRQNESGLPVFDPGGPRFRFNPLGAPEEPEDEETEKARWRAWEEAVPIGDLIDEGDPGREMRDIAAFSEEDLRMLRTSAVFGTVGTFVWAFGDLIDRL